MQLTQQEKDTLHEPFCKDNDRHRDLLEKVTRTLGGQLKAMNFAEQRMFQGIFGWVLAPLAKIIPLPYSYEAAISAATVWTWQNGEALYQARPEYSETFNSALEVYDWLTKVQLDFENVHIQNFLLLMAPLVSKQRQDEIKAQLDAPKTDKRWDYGAIATNTAKNLASSAWGVFSREEAKEKEQALPAKFFKAQMLKEIESSRNGISLTHYMHGEGASKLNVQDLLKNGTDFVRERVPGMNYVMPAKLA